MAIKAALNFLSFIALIVLFGGLLLTGYNASRGRRVQPGIILAVAGVIGFIIITPLNAGLNLIQPQEVGVVFRQIGQADEGTSNLREPLQPGLRWVIPFVDQVTIYPTEQQSVTMAGVTEGSTEVSGLSAVRAISGDGQVINLDVTVIYRLDSVEINSIHTDWRNTYEAGYVVPQTRSEVRNAVSEFGAEDIYSGGRARLEADLFSELDTRLEREGIILADILIRNIQFSDDFTQAIEEKQIAEQEAQRAVFLVQQAEQSAEERRVTARGEADAVVIRAEGDAQSIIIRAQAEAEGLELINAVLATNPNLIQWQYINELADQANLVVVPSDTPFLFDADSFIPPEETVAATPETEPRSAPESSTEAPADTQDQ